MFNGFVVTITTGREFAGRIFYCVLCELVFDLFVRVNYPGVKCTAPWLSPSTMVIKWQTSTPATHHPVYRRVGGGHEETSVRSRPVARRVSIYQW